MTLPGPAVSSSPPSGLPPPPAPRSRWLPPFDYVRRHPRIKHHRLGLLRAALQS